MENWLILLQKAIETNLISAAEKTEYEDIFNNADLETRSSLINLLQKNLAATHWAGAR